MIEQFRQAVERHKDRIYTMAYYSLGSPEEAEDVTQEVLIRLWDNWQRIAADGLKGWIIHVTKNACIDAARKRRTYRRRVAATGDEAIVTEAVSTTPSPHEIMERSEMRRRLEKAIRDIDEPYRSLIVLREIEDMKYLEISEAMNMPLNTVKTYIHRARRMLRDQLRGLLKESWDNGPEK